MTQEEINDLAEQDALLMCPKHEGYHWNDQVGHKNGFIRGYKAAQKTMFTEDDLREAIDKARNLSAMFASKEDIIRLVRDRRDSYNTQSN